MRPAEISSEQIIEAGEELRAAGRNITGFALRQKVGGGNPTRLKQVWDEYCGALASDVEKAPDLPAELSETLELATKSVTDTFLSVIKELNAKAVAAAEKRAGEVIKAAAEQREQMERELLDAANTVEDIEKNLELATDKIAALERLVAQVTEEKQHQAVELAALRERAENLQKSAAFADSLESENQELSNKVAHLSGQLESLTKQNETLMALLEPKGSKKK